MQTSRTAPRSGGLFRVRTPPSFASVHTTRLLRAVYPAFRVLFPNQVIQADDLARVMVEAVVRGTGHREGPVFENRDIRAMVEALHSARR